MSAWSRCTKNSGRTIATPLEAANLAPSEAGRTAGPAAVNAATTDLACKKEAALVATWFAVESGIQRRQIAQNPVPLRDRRNRLTAMAKAASAATC